MLVNHQYKRKYPIFPIVENTTLKNSDPSELRTTGASDRGRPGGGGEQLWENVRGH